MSVILLSGSGNGTGGGKKLPYRATSDNMARWYTFYASGTFSGATVGLEVQPPGSSDWFDSGIALTAIGAVNVEVHAAKVRATVMNGGGGVSIDARIE